MIYIFIILHLINLPSIAIAICLSSIYCIKLCFFTDQNLTDCFIFLTAYFIQLTLSTIRLAIWIIVCVLGICVIDGEEVMLHVVKFMHLSSIISKYMSDLLNLDLHVEAMFY